MIDYSYDGTGEDLRQEIKTDWKAGKLSTDSYFIHGGTMLPSHVHRYGLSPLYGKEFLTYWETKQPIAGGKLLFSFLVAAGTQPPANIIKPKGVQQLWGYQGHSYVFFAPRGTTIYCQKGVVAGYGQEVAFPYILQSSDIRFYCAPSDPLVSKDQRTNFMMVAWNNVVAALKPPKKIR